ncbi:DUF4240 domain-containing protein [Wenzhouxiangella marina]|uniref:Uncharacterized protein n=1 Tax=Wenzhouxiangella marina TaxID=1579979 RepID=A0A0K0XY47_9GAMM|nr:DUF4240 domain-containing protein [Wenzhouxiangella marina]AKS42546.1 hypothetical protein WM2015_2183 [Wenzhouxiangella marina]MBB6085675.1 hypothetical protein [Wenzhouxiangella marina]
MQESQFWSIIAMLDWEESGDDDAVLAPVVAYLTSKPDEEIFHFEEILAQKLHALDTRAHAREIGEDAYVDGEAYFSVDAFLYARCVVVANGKALFEQVLRNPREFPKDMEFEAILYVAQEAYEQKNEKEWDYVSPTDYETYSNLAGWQ